VERRTRFGDDDTRLPGAPVRALIVDDHEIARRGLRALLESSGEISVVGEVGTVASALEWAEHADADVAVLDIRLPDGNGIELCRELRVLRPDMRSLMLTSFDDDQAIVASHLAGAAGYVVKQARCTDLIGTVLRVAAGASVLDPWMTARVHRRLVHPDPRDPAVTRLTREEQRVLQLLASGSSDAEIAHDMGIDELTAKLDVSRVLVQLGLSQPAWPATGTDRRATATLRP